MTRVYMVQRPHHPFEVRPDWLRAYGPILVVLPVGNIPIDFSTAARKMEAVLGDFTEEDYLLPLGDPFIVAAAVFILARRFKEIRTLRWDEGLYQYMPDKMETP